MIRTIFPSLPCGTIAAPASKSHVQRLAAAAMLAHGTTVIHRFSSCDDVDAALEIIHALGAHIQKYDTILTITSTGFCSPTSDLHCNESGLCARMFAPIAALSSTPVVITGSGSLQQRSMKSLITALGQCGVTVSHHNDRLPLTITGALRSPEGVLDASESSQFVTGLLMALPCVEKDSVVSLENPVSVPYLQLTEEVLRAFGIEITREESYRYSIPGKQHYRPAEINAEGDWSGAAFPLTAGALCGDVTVTGLNERSTQADIKIVEILSKVGARIHQRDDCIRVSANECNAFSCDATDAPDLFPVLTALAAHCKGVSKITGVHRLGGKESDRAAVLVKEFGRLGVKITIKDNSMHITGGTVHGGVIDAHNDHRIAMAGAVLALKAEGAITVTQAECVSKSYPQFWDDCKSVGVKVENNML